jgi:hypothetical protein
MIVEAVTPEIELGGYHVRINGVTYFTRDFVQEGDTVEITVLNDYEVKLTTSSTVDDISLFI